MATAKKKQDDGPDLDRFFRNDFIDREPISEDNPQLKDCFVRMLTEQEIQNFRASMMPDSAKDRARAKKGVVSDSLKEAMKRYRSQMLALALVDENGDQIFSPDQWRLVGQKLSAPAVRHAYAQVCVFNDCEDLIFDNAKKGEEEEDDDEGED